MALTETKPLADSYTKSVAFRFSEDLWILIADRI